MAPKSGFLSGLKSMMSKTPTGVSQEAQSMGRLRRQAQMGKKYVDLETPPQNFNPSGFLRGTQVPKKTP